MSKLAERSYFIRLLVSFLALATLTLIFSSLIIYKNYESETIQENKAISEKMLSQTVYGADLIWDWASKHAIELYNNGLIFNLIYGSDITTIDEFNAQRVMSYAMSSNPFIYSIYLYNGNIDKVFSTVGIGYSTKDFFDQDILQVLKNKTLNSEYRFIPRTISFKHYDKEYNEDVISLIVTEPVSDNKSVNGALILNVKVNTIQNLIYSFNTVKDDYFIIADDGGKVISYTRAGMFQKDLSGEKYLQKIKQLHKNSGYFTEYVNGKKNLITYVISDKLKWSFIRLNEYNKLFEKTYGMRNMIVILFFVLFLVNIGFSIWLSWKFYTPIGGLVKLVNKNMTGGEREDASKKINEFEYITREYNRIIENSNTLKRQYSDNRGFLRCEFLKNLLTGGMHYYNDIGKKFEELDIELQLNNFLVVLLRIDNYWRDFINNSKQDIALLKFAISNISQEIISSRYINEAFSVDYDGIAVILNTKNEEKSIMEENLIMLVRQIQRAVKGYLEIDISGAVGKTADKLADLPSLFKNVMEISNYRLIYGKGSVIIPDMVGDNVDRDYAYPVDMEKEILDNLKLHNYAGVEEKTRGFFDSLKCLSYDDILMSVNRLAYASIKTIVAISGKMKLELSYKTLRDEVEHMDTLEDIRQRLLNIYWEFIEGVSINAENVKQKHVDKVLEIINKEYTNANLSSEELSSRLGLSSNYLREIFKEMKGVSLSGYISEYRCEKAKDMLLQTDLTVVEISERIGLVNQNYFFTLFKKHSGLTPAQYRIKNKSV